MDSGGGVGETAAQQDRKFPLPQTDVCVVCLEKPMDGAYISTACRHVFCLGCAEGVRRSGWTPAQPVSRPGDDASGLNCEMQYGAVCPLCRAKAAPPGQALELVDAGVLTPTTAQFACAFCDQKFRKRERLAQHYVVCRRRLPPCPYCKAALESRRTTRSLPDVITNHILTNQCSAQRCGHCFRVGTCERIMQCENQHAAVQRMMTGLQMLHGTLDVQHRDPLSAVGLTLGGVRAHLRTMEHLLFEHQPQPGTEEWELQREMEAQEDDDDEEYIDDDDDEEAKSDATQDVGVAPRGSQMLGALLDDFGGFVHQLMQTQRRTRVGRAVRSALNSVVGDQNPFEIPDLAAAWRARVLLGDAQPAAQAAAQAAANESDEPPPLEPATPPPQPPTQ